MKFTKKNLIIVLVLALTIGSVLIHAACSADNVPFTDAEGPLWQDPHVVPRTEPMELLVIVAQFRDYNEYSEEYFKEKFYNEIFASGAVEDGTYTVNDYFKEISNGQFYYKPIVLNGNTTGIYPLYLDENYIYDKIPEYCRKLFELLVAQGLDPQNFLLPKDTASSYYSEKARILIYFPACDPHVDGYFLIPEDVDAHHLIACVDYANSADKNAGTPPSVVCHELGHTLGFLDLYLQGNFFGLMNNQSTSSDVIIDADLGVYWDRYPSYPSPDIPAHLDPFYKIAMHWYYPQVIESTSVVTLYPASNSEKYNPVIVKTNSSSQYFIIENRQMSGFDIYMNTGHILAKKDGVNTDGMILDTGSKIADISGANYKGINIWRIDALSFPPYGMSTERKWNWPINILHYPGEKASLMKYKNLTDANDSTRIDSGIVIEFLSENEDGSITVKIVIP